MSEYQTGFEVQIELQLHKTPIEHVIIDGMYSEAELKLIWRELEFLTPKLKSPQETNSAQHNDGVYKKQNKGLFLDQVYADRDMSDILRANRRLFNPGMCEAVSKLHPVFKFLALKNFDVTLINYYEDTDKYEAHIDSSVLSAITFFVKEPLCFTGGEFIFTEYNHKIEIKNNRVVLFCGGIEHAVTPVKMQVNGENNGRYSMAQFIVVGGG